MKRFTPILILLLLVFSSCYDNHQEVQSSEFRDSDNCDISQLQERCKEGLYLITSDMICVCRVTSSDQEGNFYRSIVVEDSSGGAEIKLGTYNNAVQYPVGLEVELHLNGTAIMFENGVMQVGLPPHSYDILPREMEAQAVIDSHVIRTNSVKPMQPPLCNIASLDTSICGRFIAINNLNYSPSEEEEGSAEEYARFMDSEGNSLFLYVSPFADFSISELPSSDVALQGILYYETVGLGIGKQFVIRPRFKDDISTSNGAF